MPPSTTQVPRSLGSLVVDLVFGALGPAACFAFDPIVFRGDGAMLGHWRGGAYVFAGFEVLALLAWLGMPRRTRWGAACLGGILAVGAVGAFLIALALAPIAVPASLVGIGLPGLVPWFTGWVFLRNGRGAFRAAAADGGRPRGAGTATLLGVALACALPAGVQIRAHRVVDRSVAELVRGEPGGIQAAVRRLSVTPWALDLRPLVQAWRAAEDGATRARFAMVYEQVTGRSISEVGVAD